MRPQRMLSAAIALVMATVTIGLLPAAASADVMINGWHEPVPLGNPAASWMASGCNGAGEYIADRYHTGRDYWASAGTSVKAVGNGTVVQNADFGAGYARAVFIRHTAADGTQFTVLYGHIDSPLTANSAITAGSQVGTIANIASGPHLHLGLVAGTTYPASGWGNQPCANWPGTNGFSDPIAFLNAHPGSSGSGGGQMLYLDTGQAVWAKSSLGFGGWTQETSPGSAKAIAAGGSRHSLIDFCDAVWTREGVGAGGWTQETGCGSAKAIRVASNGTRVILDFCGAVWGKTGSPSWGGWTQEATCDSAKDVQADGDTHVLLSMCDAVWTRTGVGVGGWVQETNCYAGKAVTVGSNGVRTITNYCDALWSKGGAIGFGGWVQETNCDSAKSVVAGGDTRLVLDLCGAIYAKTGAASWGGWVNMASCDSAKAIEVGSSGRSTLLALDNSVWAKDGLGFGGWGQQEGPNSAKAIAVG